MDKRIATGKQEDADALRAQAREMEQRAAHLSDEQGGAEMEQQARALRKEAQEIEKCLSPES